tara:strand:+ start:662 stop:901 length:240 start_codon:yes stop_codon:yes gene_type:complete
MLKLKLTLPQMLLHQYFIDKAIPLFWLAAPKKQGFQDGSPVIQRKDGCTLNIPFYPVQQIHGFEEKGEVQKVELKKLRD